MKFNIITIFPDLFNDFKSQSLIARAIKKRLISIKAHDLRKWTKDRHKTVDGRPYGGGAGMVLKIQPIFNAVESLNSKFKNQSAKLKKTSHSAQSRVILLSAKGKQFTQKDAKRLAKYNQLVFICGRYEGVDERVAKYVADEEISVGPYVLFGGEIPAMIIMESVSRLIPGVLGKPESLKEESFSNGDCKLVNGNWKLIKEYPQYTRPEVFVQKTRVKNKESKASPRIGQGRVRIKNLKVPKVLLSGDHAKIHDWRKKNSKHSR